MQGARAHCILKVLFAIMCFKPAPGAFVVLPLAVFAVYYLITRLQGRPTKIPGKKGGQKKRVAANRVGLKELREFNALLSSSR